MELLILDFETTGLDTKNDRILEIGGIVYDAKAKDPITFLSWFVDPGVEASDEATEITGITQNWIKRFGRPTRESILDLSKYFVRADYIVAHNGTQFDKPLLFSEIDRLTDPPDMNAKVLEYDFGLLSELSSMKNVRWIDTVTDVPYPAHITTRKLTHLAAEHGFVNPFPHRALADCLTTMKILQCYDIDDIVQIAMEPKYSAVLKLDYSQTELREKAKAESFRWNPNSKDWRKTVKESETQKLMSLFSDKELKLERL